MSTYDPRKFGSFLSSLRKEAQLEIPLVADKLRVNESQIHLWESGKDLIPKEYLEPLATLYSIPYSELLDVWSTERDARK